MKLEIRDISFSYSGKEILSSVSFILNSGDVTALLGRNGSGKTTLMRLILGFIKPDSGAIMLDGRDIREMSSKDRAKVIAYIPQKLSDAYPYSVIDSVMMGRAPSLSVFSSPKEKDREKAEEALAVLGISNLKDRNVNTLSGGERQLVLIARAITQEASFMVMDEPTSALDYANALMVMEKTEELRKEGEVGTGIWNKEEAFVRLGSLPDFMKFVDSTKKARIIFEYDPDYPKALLITRADLAV